MVWPNVTLMRPGLSVQRPSILDKTGQHHPNVDRSFGFSAAYEIMSANLNAILSAMIYQRLVVSRSYKSQSRFFLVVEFYFVFLLPSLLPGAKTCFFPSLSCRDVTLISSIELCQPYGNLVYQHHLH